MTTTQVDRHNERLGLSTLANMVDDVKAMWLPLWHEHDPRIPPLGRVVDAYIEEREGGEFALIGVVEQFERGDVTSYDASRVMKIADAPPRLQVEFDRSHRDAQSQQLIVDIAEILGTTPQPQVKKALQPLSILTLTIQATLGGIVGAIAKTLTDDAWLRLKKKIALVLKRRRGEGIDHVFQFRFVVVLEGREVEVDLLATAPGEAQLERIFKNHVAMADDTLLKWLPGHPEVRRVVFNASGPELKFSYALRSDVIVIYDGPKPAPNSP